ncbi:hypothetical protein PB1_05090 [Bacillus methanolicus PB1]|uniref:Uncharacterized protein n=1 Tax=Bacillus methanolicus PB1 TaxID=997296 RepID=I3E707_BACMT|nr:hypothetical protein PB1_05090 [Bacillus methanolicus PB1]
MILEGKKGEILIKYELKTKETDNSVIEFIENIENFICLLKR